MVKFKSKTKGIEVCFEQEGLYMDSQLVPLGENITTSISEHKKMYVTRYATKPSDIQVKYMHRDEYVKLLELVTEDNLFTIETTEGDYFNNCFISGGLQMKKMASRSNDSYFFTGSLNVEVR